MQGAEKIPDFFPSHNQIIRATRHASTGSFRYLTVVREKRKSRLKIRCKNNAYFLHPSKEKTIVVALPLVLPTSPYRTAAVAKFG